MGSFGSIEDILSEIDIDCTTVGYDGNQVWCLPRTIQSFNRRVNVIEEDLYPVRGFVFCVFSKHQSILSKKKKKSCPTYESRLIKYADRGFAILDVRYKGIVDPKIIEKEPSGEWSFVYTGNDDGGNMNPGVGLKLLLLCEKYPKVKQQLLSMCSASIPYGKDVTFDNFATKLNLVNINENDFDRYTHW